MTRRITPHKGGRTARLPSGRIRPQTLERIHATMTDRKMSFSDLVEERWQGDEHMNAEQHADNISKLTTRQDVINYIRAIEAAAIAAAVRQEREAILREADSLEYSPIKWSALIAFIQLRSNGSDTH